MVYFIDVQGFKGSNNQFVLKEIALLHDENNLQHFIIQPPSDFENLPYHLQAQAQWLFRNHHGFTWNGGFTSLDSVTQWFSNILRGSIVYVKGLEKAKWIADLFYLHENVDIRDLDAEGCPKLDTLKKTFTDTPRCIIHSGTCALQNVYLCKKFVENKINV